MKTLGKKEIIQFIIPLIIAIVSLFISIRSCSIASESIEISKKEYELKLEPRLTIKLEPDGEQYSLLAVNSGPLPIINLRITKEIVLYSESDTSSGWSSTGFDNTWIIKDRFSSGDTVRRAFEQIYPMSKNDLEHPGLYYTDIKEITSILLKISYQKETDLTEYKYKKYFFAIYKFHSVVTNDNSSQSIVTEIFDPEKSNKTYYQELLKMVKKMEEKRDWENRFE